MRASGLLIITAAFCVPLFWFAGLATQNDVPAIFSQYLGVCALIAMSFSQVFATRIRGLEVLFGGMDRIYVLHKWLGILALACILLHDTIDADIDGLGRETGLTDLAETLGEISLYGFLALVTLSIATFVPYHLWKYTHKLMGAFFAASAFHYAFILKPFSNLDPLGLYVLAFCFAGILAYVYTLLPLGRSRAWRCYTIRSAQPNGDALTITLTPEQKARQHQAGQFAFVSFEIAGAEEVHPFTISKQPDDEGELRFTIKALGDYTRSLPKHLQEGAYAYVSRPFGHFKLKQTKSEQAWIASGVGITPFVAWAQALEASQGDVHLFYSFRTREAASHLTELEELAASKPNLRLHLTETSSSPRLTADQIASHFTGDKKQIELAFCGPKEMRETLKHDLTKLGFSSSRFRYEEFEIRSGLGFRRLLSWLLSRTVR